MDHERINAEPYKFEYTILLKLNNGLDTVNQLLQRILDKPQFVDSICILLRTLLSDVITLDYVYTVSRGNEEEYLRQIQNVYYDHVQFTLKNIDLYGFLYNERPEVIEEKKHILINARKQYFDSENIPLPYLKGLKPCTGLVKSIKSETSDKYSLSYIILAFEHYDIFSKYEHLGDLTNQLILRGYKEDAILGILREVQTSINVLLHYESLLIKSYWGQENKGVKDYDLFRNEISELKLCA